MGSTIQDKMAQAAKQVDNFYDKGLSEAMITKIIQENFGLSNLFVKRRIQLLEQIAKENAEKEKQQNQE